MGYDEEMVLMESISYGRTFFYGVHVFQEDMSYGSICLKGGHALLEKMSYGRSYIGGVHVSRMAYLRICCVLLKYMSFWRAVFP